MASLITIDDVMARLGIRRKALMRLIGNGSLAAYKVGQQWRFEPKDVDAYLRSVKFHPRHASNQMVAVRRRARTQSTSAGATRYF